MPSHNVFVTVVPKLELFIARRIVFTTLHSFALFLFPHFFTLFSQVIGRHTELDCYCVYLLINVITAEQTILSAAIANVY